MVKVSICIPTPVDDPANPDRMGNYALLSRCLSSIVKYKSPDIEYEFIVIGNMWRGFEVPVNMALKLATGDFVWLLNDDVELTGHGVDEYMLRPFDNPKIGLVSAIGYANYEWTPAGLPSYWNVMFRKRCLDEVGFLDEMYELFSSDHDHAMRVLRAGWKIAHLNPFNVYHKMSSTTRRLPQEQSLKDKAKKQFLEKWKL